MTLRIDLTHLEDKHFRFFGFRFNIVFVHKYSDYIGHGHGC